MPNFYKNNKNNVISVLSALILSFTAIYSLQGCGGGGDSDPVPETVPDADVSGIYEGTFTQTGGGVFNLQGVIHDNRAMFILDEFESGNALIYDGTLTIDGNGFTSNFKEYNQGETTLIGSAFAITGSVDSQGVVTITATSPTLGEGKLSLTPNTVLYALGADLNNIAFRWSSSPMNFLDGVMLLFLGDPLFLNDPAFVDPEGVFEGEIGAVDSCDININREETKGRITIPDASKNTYQVTMTFECTDPVHAVLNGTYTGLAYSTGTTNLDNLIFITTKNDRAIAAVMAD